MNQEPVDKRNFDVASIGRGEGKKRSNFVQNALQIDKGKIAKAGNFIKVFSDIFLKKEAGVRSYF